MALAQQLLAAPDLRTVEKIVRKKPKSSLEKTMSPLADEVLRLMRTDAERALDVADRTAVVADALGDPRSSARATWVRGHALVGMLRNREAAECYESAAGAYREMGDTLESARVAIGWIAALVYLADYAKALEVGEKARRVLLRNGHFAQAARLDLNLGNVHHRVERPKEALRHYDRALKVARRLDDPVMNRIIQFNRANSLTWLGRLDAAQSLYREVADGAREAGETRTHGMADYSLGYLHLLQGEYGQAYETLDAAREVFEELRDPHYLMLAYTDLAELFVEMNGFRRALGLGRRARTLAEKHGTRYEAGRAALFLGMASLGLGENARAATHLEDALGAFRAEGNVAAAALCSVYLADLEVRAGRPDEAARQLRTAADVFSKKGMALREATTLIRLAFVELERGKAPAAQQAITRARTALRRTHAPWLRAQLDHLSGRLELERGRVGLAVRRLREAVDRIESMRTRIGIDEFRVSFSRDKAPVYADLVEAILRRGGPDAVAEAFEAVERSRSRALVDLLAGRLGEARERAAPGAEGLLDRLEKLRARVNWLSGFRPDPGGGRRDESRRPRRSAELRRREEEIADVVQRLQGRDARLGALAAGETVGLAEVQRDLPADTTLLEYYVTDHATLAFVVDREEARAVRLDVTRGEISSELSGLRFQLEKWGYGDRYVRARERTLGSSLESRLRRLGEKLWDPLEIQSSRVQIVPHGALHSLPFHALVDPAGRPLVEERLVTYVPSASARRYLGHGPARPALSSPEARVLAVAVGDSSVPQVEAEARRVRRLFRRGRILRGPRATRERFREAAAEADVIHVATHGVFREDDPHFSALRLTDGWMSLYDFYGLRLGAQLVCLSACQSGRSWIGAGDELVGLSRGFFHAGAATLVVSLWPVHDDSTARLMELFYQGLRGRKPPEEALRAAMLNLRESQPHPYHWAPFQLIGRGSPG